MNHSTENIEFMTEYNCDIYIQPVYSFITENKWSIEYPNKSTFFIDTKQLEKIINCSKRFVFHNPNDNIPSYGVNYRRMSLLEFFHGVNPYTEFYAFKNENRYDIRSNNVCFTKPSFYQSTKKYNVIKYLNNEKQVKKGRYSGETKNYMCEIKTSDNNIKFIMECNNNILCILCPKSYQKILDYENKHKKEIIWSHTSNGYILGNNNLYIHQVITGCHGNGKGTKNISVDHIDQDPLNNTFDNLRIATQEQQIQNTTGIKEGTKRERNKNAQPLPDGITQDMLKKYVVFVGKDCYNKEKKLYRDFFRIEGHPKLDKEISSQKSVKVPILEKLAQANKIVEDLEKNIYPTNENKLPKYISNKDNRGKPHLIFDRKEQDGKRQTLKMVLPNEYELEEQLEIFKEKIKNKYNFEII